MATWTGKDIWRYVSEHELPEHPLFSKGYTSIGCQPCTRPVYDQTDERSGRWVGQEKTECGLHTFLRQSDELKLASPDLPSTTDQEIEKHSVGASSE